MVAAAAAEHEPIDLSQFDSEEQLLFKGPGADVLKAELSRLGLKCGGAPAERDGLPPQSLRMPCCVRA